MTSTHLRRADDSQTDGHWQLQTDVQTLFDSLPIGIAISEDTQCEDVRANAEFYRIFRLKPGSKIALARQLRRPRFQAFHRGQKLTRFELPMQQAIRDNQPIRNFMFQLRFPGGAIVQVLANANPLRDAQNAVRGAVGTYLIVDCPDNQPPASPDTHVSQLLVDLISQAERDRR